MKAATARSDGTATVHQKYRRVQGGVQRSTSTDAGVIVQKYSSDADNSTATAKAWAIARLRSTTPAPLHPTASDVRVLDVFSGCGGFGAGFAEAAASVGRRAVFQAAIDLDEAALATHARNLRTRVKLRQDAASLLDFALSTSGESKRLAYAPHLLSHELRSLVGKCDAVIGGPPCQGHSNLNNHTRRSDDRNWLYLVVPAIAIALSAPLVIIENVTMVLKDPRNIVRQASDVLRAAGYHVAEIVLHAEEFGVAQLRRRHFLIASRHAPIDLGLVDALKVPRLSAWDAIGDLADIEVTGDYDRPTVLTPVNQSRVDFLFERDLYDLPNSERPDCHKDGHTYPSVYGRMKRDEPCLTITGGFLQPGQGRFIHPKRPRSLTPHEGARLQGFADHFQFVGDKNERLSRKDYARMIGDSVPPPLAYVASMLGLASIV